MTDTEPSATDFSILVVDDIPANLRLLHDLLGGQGYRVRLAPHGVAALQSVREDPPDLLLLDVVMPRLDGFAVCQALKDDPATRDIPIIFISALSETDDKLRAFAVGGVDYVTKPFQSDEVLARVKTHLELLRHRRALLALNERLKQSNQELEQFANVVAHDLKNPLQSIMSLSELILLTADPGLSAETRKYLGYMQGSALLMSQLVDSVLRYSRLTSRALPFEPVDLGAMAHKVRSDLGARIAELGASVQIGPLPWVQADATQMWQLLENLVGNALKFHRPGFPPRVAIHAEVHGRQATVSVQDDGVGFDERDKEQIFQIFSRLPEHTTIDGTGIGLALCKKIVERHGGTIDVTSKPGEGATFTFTLQVCPAP